MSQMGAVRRHKGRSFGVLLAALLASVAVTVFILPALAATGSAIPPASGLGITPTSYGTGGQSNDCQLFNSTAPYQFRIDNPQTGAYATTAPNGRPVTFTLKVLATGSKKDKFFDFTITGAAASDIGVKGGSETARYAYAASTVGPVIADTALHATLDNQGKLYNLSNVTFCYGTGAAVSGTVFADANDNATRDAGESGQQGWTVKLYSGAAVAATTTSAADGSYQFPNVTLGSAYTVCIVGQATWQQTLPTGQTAGTTTCSGALESTHGYAFTLVSSQGGLDFGNVGTVTSSCNAPFGIPGSYEIQFAGDPPCKANEFVLSYSDAGNKLASLRPVLTGIPPVPMVEKITWTFPGADQNPFTLIYDDTLPYGDGTPAPMKFCQLDPRVPGQEFDLGAGYQTTDTSSSVLQAGETSCLIQVVQIAGGKYVAFVYSSIDGWRSTT